MTVQSSTSRNQYSATSGQTVFAYTFEVFDKNDIAVLQNGTLLSEGTHYTVSGVGVDTGGNITLVTGATAGDIITLYRDMALERLTDYQNSGDFLAQDVNDDFDRLWAASQQVDAKHSLNIRKPSTDLTSINMELPEAADRADKYLRFDSTGAVSTTTGMLYEFVTVESYGAVGDGVTDDTAAIQSALDTGRDIVFTSANYLITSPLTVGSQRVIGGVGLKGGSGTLAQSQININGNHACFVNGAGAVSFEIEGFLIRYGDAIPTDAGTESSKIGFYFTNNTLWPQLSSVSNCRVKGAWYAIYDNTGTYMTRFERINAWLCRKGFYKQNGTTVLFDTCFVEEGHQGFWLQDIISPTLLNCAVDDLDVNTTDSTYDTGNFVSGTRSLSIIGFDAESNTITGNGASFFYFDAATANISGFTGYLNTLACGSGEENYFFRVDNSSTVSFNGSRPARNTSDLAYSGTGGSPHTLLANNTSYVSISGSRFTAPNGGSPAAPFVANAQGSSIIHKVGSLVSGVQVNTTGNYESGTWTPTLSGYGIVGSPTVTGRYVRIDDVVHCWVYFSCDASNKYESIAGTSVIDSYPNGLTPSSSAPCNVVNQNMVNLGHGRINSFGCYTPTWASTVYDVTVEYTYYIG